MTDISPTESNDMKVTDAELSKVTTIVIELLKKWGLNEKQKTVLIGETTSPEIHLRLSLLLNIHAELRLMFNNPLNVYGFMTMINHNEPFNGTRPIDLACQNIEGLKLTYQAICNIY
ncbi:hypothetical protein [Aliiglaciecola lipolytica]|uniref:hypothetical protein n=1 Tax=Aliiglaciecola lipolytica TaxID=477689 RepID=UPI001C08E813|nr:hypothetical protein [Aliiglaciecola lipolytica]MBU2877059.1 hypothetical protein [Aliiglaciecola lipolytica]